MPIKTSGSGSGVTAVGEKEMSSIKIFRVAPVRLCDRFWPGG